MQLLPRVSRIVSMDPIIVRPGEPGRLSILLPYSPERVAKIKTVPGRAWHAPEKLWSVPESASEQLRTLPGIGPALATRILEARRERPFRSVDDLRRVKGVGAKTLEKLRPFLEVGSP